MATWSVTCAVSPASSACPSAPRSLSRLEGAPQPPHATPPCSPPPHAAAPAVSVAPSPFRPLALVRVSACPSPAASSRRANSSWPHGPSAAVYGCGGCAPGLQRCSRSCEPCRRRRSPRPRSRLPARPGTSDPPPIGHLWHGAPSAHVVLASAPSAVLFRCCRRSGAMPTVIATKRFYSSGTRPWNRTPTSHVFGSLRPGG